MTFGLNLEPILKILRFFNVFNDNNNLMKYVKF